MFLPKCLVRKSVIVTCRLEESLQRDPARHHLWDRSDFCTEYRCFTTPRGLICTIAILSTHNLSLDFWCDASSVRKERKNIVVCHFLLSPSQEYFLLTKICNYRSSSLICFSLPSWPLLLSQCQLLLGKNLIL